MNFDSNYIYKYTPLSVNALKLLIKGELWFGQPINLNDPFEGEFIIEENELSNDKEYLMNFYQKNFDYSQNYIDKKLKEIEKNPAIYNYDSANLLRKRLKEKYGVTCFSNTQKNILLWSHYADSHKGISLVFDKNELLISLNEIHSDIKLVNISYVNKIPSAKFEKMNENKHFAFSIYQNLFSYKLTDWEKESEIRLLKHFESLDDKRSIKFNKKSLKGIILGENISQDDIDTLAHLIKNDKNYDIFWAQAKKDLKNNTMLTEEIKLAFFTDNMETKK